MIPTLVLGAFWCVAWRLSDESLVSLLSSLWISGSVGDLLTVIVGLSCFCLRVWSVQGVEIVEFCRKLACFRRKLKKALAAGLV